MEPTNFSPYLRLIQKTGATKHPYGFSATDLLLKRAQLNGQSRVLDLGCGAGHSSAYVAKNYDCYVTGVDISKDAIERAEALHAQEPFISRMDFLVADALKLPFSNNAFDLVLCESVLFFIHDKEAALAEMARVLKPGGYLALNEVIVVEGEQSRVVQDYFFRPEFGGFLVTTETMRQSLGPSWSIMVQDELPFDIALQLKAEFKNLFSLKNVLPLFEMAHQAWASKAMRDDIVQVLKFTIDMPKGMMASLFSYLLLAQKKPLS